MAKNYLCLVLAAAGMLLFSQTVSAQNYTETSSFGNSYAPLTNPTLITNNWNDSLFLQGDVGVTFNWFGKTYPFDGQGNDGMLLFGAGTVAAGTPTDSTDFDFDGFFVSLRSRQSAVNLSSMNYEVDGTAPNRILKFEWKNAGLTYGDTSDFVNFQMWLYEASSNFEAHYGKSSIKDPKVAFGKGLNGPPVGIFFASDKPKDNGKILKAYYLTGDPKKPVVNPSLDFNGLSAMPDSGTVYTFAYQGTTGIEAVSKMFSSLSIYPNPSSAIAYINYTSAEPKPVNITSLDMAGKTLQTIYNGTTEEGNRTISFNTSEFAKGVYLIKLQVGATVETRKLVVY